jgi:hypothetical protein
MTDVLSLDTLIIISGDKVAKIDCCHVIPRVALSAEDSAAAMERKRQQGRTELKCSKAQSEQVLPLTQNALNLLSQGKTCGMRARRLQPYSWLQCSRRIQRVAAQTGQV